MSDGKYFVTGRQTEEKVIGKCSVCGLDTKTVVRHRYTKQIIGESCTSVVCRPLKKQTPELRRAIDAFVKESNGLREL